MGKKKLLIVEDIELNRILLSEIFNNEFEIFEAENGKVALDIIKNQNNELSIILLDLVMPVLDGFGVLEVLNRDDTLLHTPVVLITGENDDESTLKAYEYGVSDMIYKPFNPDIVYRRVNNVIDLFEYKNDLEKKLNEAILEMQQQEERAKKFNIFLIDALSTTVEFRSQESGEHIRRVRLFTKFFLEKIANIYKLTKKQIELMSNASAMHDIGKVAISDNILLKPGSLTKEEFEIMKTHTIKGCEILDTINYFDDKETLKYCYEICRHHHEKYDGRGYPDHLVGDDIPIWAQAVALADVYDALTSKRVYKPAYSHEEAVRMICNNECGVFNPKLITMLGANEKNLKILADAINSGEISISFEESDF